jgi:hypothetical protein
MGKSTIMLMILLGILSCSTVTASVSTYTLKEALERKLVTAFISGKGGYHGKCVFLRLKNVSNQNLSIRIEAGRRLNCVYDSVQDLLITQSEMFALLPSQTREVTIYAMCCEKSNHSPGETSTYNLGAMAEARLVELAVLIEKLKAQNLTGVKAVWVLTDGISPDEISGSDSITVAALKEFVSNPSNNKKIINRNPGVLYDYSYPQSDGEIFTIEGDFIWELAASGYVSLYIYDNNGNRLMALFQDESSPAGLQTYHYRVQDATFQSGETYWVRLKQKGMTIKGLTNILLVRANPSGFKNPTGLFYR